MQSAGKVSIMGEDYDHADGMTVAAVRGCLVSHGVPTETTRVEACGSGVVIVATQWRDGTEERHVCATWQDVRDFLGY